jgi:hypothetical protein
VGWGGVGWGGVGWQEVIKEGVKRELRWEARKRKGVSQEGGGDTSRVIVAPRGHFNKRHRFHERRRHKSF